MRIKFTILLLLLLGFVGLSFWFYQRNTFSKEVLKLEILGPDTASLAEEIDYLVKFKNNGNVNLEQARLIFEYPEFSQPSGNHKTREEIPLEVIYPGQERTVSFKGRLFGKEGDRKEAKAWLNYKPKNLQSRFESATTKITVINNVPLNFEFDIPSKVVSDKEITFRLNYFSNVNYPLTNLRVLVDYPSGFEFVSASPRSLEKNEWKIDLLNQAEGGRLEIVGKFSGEVGEQKVLEAKLGIWQGNVFTVLKRITRGLEIVSPSLYLSQVINNNPRYVAQAGDLLHYEIIFKNIGQSVLKDLFMVVKLEGSLFDFKTLKTETGHFAPGDNSIIFDGRDVPKLNYLDSQEEGRVEFWVELKKDWQISNLREKNPFLKTNVSLSQAREEFTTKVASKLTLEQKAYFEDEVFGNTGPLPPEVDKTTTYTIFWRLQNFYNDVKNVKVRAVLPESVKLTGKIFPEDAVLTFDSQSREVVWNVGDLLIDENNLPPIQKTLAFQVALKLTELPEDKSVPLIGQAQLTGEDQWVGEIIEVTVSGIDINL